MSICSMRVLLLTGLLLGGWFLLDANVGFSQESQDDNNQQLENEAIKLPNLPLRTLGGNQYWSDIQWAGGWKIQRHATTHHHRLLDPDEIRVAWGNLEHCLLEMNRRIESGEIVRERGVVVILLHGLLRSNDSMETLGEYLQQHGDYTVVNLAYASSRESVETHAADLRRVIDNLSPEVSEIYFVAHSLGNIVIRHYLGDLRRVGNKPDHRFRRMVMLAPPNQGSRIAKRLSNSLVFQAVAGKSGVQLGAGWKKLSPRLDTPGFEFGIIAGAKDESDSNFSPRDFTVFLDEVRLDGAADLFTGPFFHWDIKYHPLAMEQTLHFLKHGFFNNRDHD